MECNSLFFLSSRNSWVYSVSVYSLNFLSVKSKSLICGILFAFSLERKDGILLLVSISYKYDKKLMLIIILGVGTPNLTKLIALSLNLP